MIRALILTLLACGPATAQDIRPQEADRLAAFDTSFGAAVRQAMRSGRRGDIDMLQEALAGAPLSPLASDLSGDWQCRTIKIGGVKPLVVYAAFACRFTPMGTTFDFEKLSGSQRTSGRVSLRDGQLIFLGVGFAADAGPLDYADLPAGTTGDGERQPQIGVVEQVSATQARILFPAPVVESDFDVLYLTR